MSLPNQKRPATVVDEMLSDGRTSRMLDYSGTQDIPEYPREMNCDYCLRLARHLYAWRTRGFCCLVAKRGIQSADPAIWYACNDCMALLDSDKLQLLAMKCARNVGIPQGAALLADVYYCTIAARDGEVMKWNSGERRPMIPA